MSKEQIKMENIKEFVVDYIQREYTISEDIDIMALNYVESGYIDSLGLIQFIATIEDEFSIEFTNEELASDEVRVVGELVKMIYNKQNSYWGRYEKSYLHWNGWCR